MASPTARAVIRDPLPQPPSCLLLKGIPREIRDMIYRFTFEGAKVVQSTRRKPFQTTDQWQLLLTCRQAYDEARPIFCAEIRMEFDIKRVPADFIEKVSDFTKAHVKHLGLSTGQSPSLLCRRPFGRDIKHVVVLLRQFPSLQTCYLPTEIRWLDLLQWEAMLKSEEYMLAKTINYYRLRLKLSPPAAFEKLGDVDWKDICGRARVTPMPFGINSRSLAILQVCLERMGVAELAERVKFVSKFLYLPPPGAETEVKHIACFLNYNTGKFFMSKDTDFDDDEGYRRGMVEDAAETADGAQSPAKASG